MKRRSRTPSLSVGLHVPDVELRGRVGFGGTHMSRRERTVQEGAGERPGGRSLREEVGKRDPFESLAQEAYLSVQRTASVLSSAFTRLFREHGLSEATYNVLRILRGARSERTGGGSRTCSEIGELMVSPVPDVTRLVDRLEARGLVKRARGADDKRVVRVEITKKGLDVLATLDGPVMALHERQLGSMTKTDLARLVLLLARARQSASATDGEDAGAPRR